MTNKSVGAVDKHIGAQIRAFRLRAGLTQTELAQALGITFQQLQKYENGSNRIAAARLADTAQVLGVPIQTFFADPGANSDSGALDIEAAALAAEMMRIPCGETRRIIAALVGAVARA